MKVKNGLIMAAIPAAIFANNADAAQKGNRPNVIFILMDDAGYGDFGCYNQHKIETPTHHPHTRFSILKSHFLKNNKNFL